ncbi:MAG: PKD domain-containing protein, partial [Bacteroidales bacterium]
VNNGVSDSIYSLRLISTSSHGCKDTLSKTITVYPNPKSNFNPTDSISCAPFLLNNAILNLTTYPIANDIYQWYKNGVLYATGTNFPPFNMVNDGDTVYITLITSNLHACKQDTIRKMFITIVGPVANFIPITTAGCNPYIVSFTNQSTPLGINSFWNFANGQTSSLFSPIAAFINSSNTIDSLYNVKLVVTASGTGCKDTIIHTVTVYPKPKANFAFANSIACAASLVNITNSSLVKGTPIYNWAVLNSNTVSISNTSAATPSFTFPDFQTGSDSIYQIRLIVTSGDGCKDTLIKSITVHSRPISVFSIAGGACGPWNTTITNTSQFASSYLWSVNPVGVNISNATISTPTFTFPVNNTSTAIVYNIKLTTSTNFGCQDTLTKFVTIYPKPKSDFSLSDYDSCSVLSVSTTNSSLAYNGENLSSLTFNWNASNGQTSVLTNPSFSFSNIGLIDNIYTLSLIVTSSHGCKDTISKNITVYPNPKSKFSPIDSTSCAPYILNNTLINLTTYSIANDTYQWYKNGVLYATGTNFPPFNMMNDGDTVYITLITSNIHGCKQDTLTKRFITIVNPIAAFVTPPAGCMPYFVSFVNQSTPTGLISNWTFNTGSTSTLSNPTHIFTNSSFTLDTTYNVRLVVTAGTGCTDTVIHPVVVIPKPKADFSFSISANCANSTIGVTNNSLAKGTPTYSWAVLNSTQVTISNSTAAQPGFTFPDFQSGNDSTYQIRLIVSSVDACKDTLIKNITIHPRPKSNFTISSEACGPWNTSVTNTSQNAATFLWSVNPVGVNISNTSASSPIFTFPANYTSSPLSYSILLTALSVNSCMDTITKFVNINPTALANFYFVQNAQPYPNHWRVDFFNTSINSTIWNWNFGDGSNSTLFQPNHSFPIIGVYHTTLYANNQYNCPSDTTIAIILKEQWKLFVASAFAPDDINPQVAIFKAIGKNLAEYTMQIYDTWGKLLYETHELNNTQPANGWDGTYKNSRMPMDVYVWKIYAKFIDGSIWKGMEQDGEVKPFGTVTLIR